MNITFSFEDIFTEKLQQLDASAESIGKEAVYAGANIVADEVRSRLENVLSGESTGELESSFGIAPIEVDENDHVDTSIGFDGYDSKGVANQLKARVLESGTSTHKKKPFVRPAIRATKDECVQAMAYVIDMHTKQILK